MEKKPIIKLRVYRGREVNYDAKGNVKNENHLVSLEHGSKNWVLFMKNLYLNGYCKVDVDSAWSAKEGGYVEIKDTKSFEIEVGNALNPEKEKVLTKEQLEIAELKKQMAELTGKKTKKEKKVVVKEPTNYTDKDEAVTAYIEKFGKKPFGAWDLEKLNEKIAE